MVEKHIQTINAIVPKRKRRERAAKESESGRPEIELTLDEKAVNDQVIEALGKRADIFDHNGCLAVIVDELVDSEESRKSEHRLAGRITSLKPTETLVITVKGTLHFNELVLFKRRGIAERES